MTTRPGTDAKDRIIIIIHNFCTALFFGVHKLTTLYNTLQHFLSENKIIEGKNVHKSNTYITVSKLVFHAQPTGAVISGRSYITTNNIYKVHMPYEKRQYIQRRRTKS